MKLKKAAPNGMMAKKIIVSACIVKSWLNTPALIRVLSASANCRRISNASNPPTRKKLTAETPYKMPMRLWSTVVIQLHTPLLDAMWSDPPNAPTAVAMYSPPDARRPSGATPRIPYFNVCRYATRAPISSWFNFNSS